MILREYQANKFVKVHVDNEIDFLAINKKNGFLSVDFLPNSLSGYYTKLNGSYIVDSVLEDSFIQKEDERLKKEALQLEIEKSKEFLSKTDHKTFSDYELKVGEDLSSILELRSIARKFIRENENVY